MSPSCGRCTQRDEFNYKNLVDENKHFLVLMLGDFQDAMVTLLPICAFLRQMMFVQVSSTLVLLIAVIFLTGRLFSYFTKNSTWFSLGNYK